MITFAVERWLDVKDEAAQYWQEHFEEVGNGRGQMELAPDIDYLNQIDATGGLHIVIGRQAGELVAYHASFVRPHVHYKTSLCAFTDLYWMRKDVRGPRVAVRMFQFVEASLRERGVVKIFTGTKISLDAGRLFESLGMVEVERLYTKWIGPNGSR